MEPPLAQHPRSGTEVGKYDKIKSEYGFKIFIVGFVPFVTLTCTPRHDLPSKPRPGSAGVGRVEVRTTP